MKTRKRSLSPDPKGQYRPYIGKYHAADGVLRPYRFNLGTDREEAERRYSRHQELYDESCKVAGDLWAPLALAYAKQIASGARKVTCGGISSRRWQPAIGPSLCYVDISAG